MFLSRPIRIIVIIHLCFAFASLFFLITFPFAERVLVKKNRAALYDSVLKKEELYHTLPLETRLKLEKNFAEIKTEKIVSTNSPFAWGWTLFSIAISILILLQIEGASLAAFLLPLLILLSAFSPRKESKTQNSFFPSEEYVMSRYNSSAIKKTHNKQVIEKAWELYLINEWTKERPSEEKDLYQLQLARGQFAFDLGRLNRIIETKEVENVWLELLHAPPSLVKILLNLSWNLFFPFFIYFSKKNRPLKWV